MQEGGSPIFPIFADIGGWPTPSGFLFPIPKLWVPRSCAFCRGGYDAAGTMTFYARTHTVEPGLRIRRDPCFPLFLIKREGMGQPGERS